MGLQIKELYIEYQKEPLGIDEKLPRFSWELVSQEQNTIQTACKICVGSKEAAFDYWDSGKINTRNSGGITYKGQDLKPCTTYYVTITVWDNHNNVATGHTKFETGFLDSSIKGWEGAKWIGAPRYTVCSQNRGVFIIESKFRFEEGSKRGGIVFGANDFRLLDKRKNEYGIEGENYIRFEINLEGLETEEGLPFLDIYRVGYAREDKPDIPFARTALVNFEGEEKVPVITIDNAYDYHTIRIEVDGNNSFTYINDILVDAIEEDSFFGKEVKGRTLNPRGHNDVLTYPRLNEIGFFAGKEDRVYFKNLTVRNMRTPSLPFIRETPQGDLYGRKSIFTDKLPVKEDSFLVKGIQITEDPSNTSIPMLRTTITTDEKKEVSKARLYITSRGIYECKINGEEITDRLLNPGLTQYDKRINYQTYDITDKINNGKNGVGVTLSSGWWSDAQTFTVRNYNYFGDKEALLAKVLVSYEDGSSDVFVSNTESWKYYGKGPYTYASFFMGECYDSRKADLYDEYSQADYDDTLWEVPVEISTVPINKFRAMPPGFGRSWPAVNQGQPEYIGEYDAPVYIVDQVVAKSCKEIEEGVYIYDFGQNMAGVPRITFHEKPDTKIVIRCAETLYPDMPEYAGNENKIMMENYRDATSTDVYICSGNKDGESYQPKFTFHGYRYIEISGVEKAPKLEEVISLQYSSVVNFDGSFESSDPLLNRFVENVKWSQKCNFINIPTDCPQRNERMGWAGDTHVFCPTALMNSNLKLFYERNLDAMADLQTDEGRYPEIAPVGGGFGGITYECATIFMAWELYQQYGDKRTLEKYYPGMKKYMEYMKDKGLPGEGEMSSIGPLGDWLAPEETDLQLLWNAFYYKEAYLMGRIAHILDLPEDEKEYFLLAEKVKKFWNETFLDPESKITRGLDGKVCDTQCSYALGLEYGVIIDKEAAGKHLLRKTRDLGHTVGTGFFGTGLLNAALTNLGYSKDAYKLMLQTQYPSWLYPVTQGATTIWERWDSYTKEKGFGGQNAMNSFNHYSLGSVLSWMYSYILGIKKEEDYPGFEHFTLKPVIGPLEYAFGSVASPNGTIYSGWKKVEDKLEYTCEIPVNSTASLYLPDGQVKELGSGKYSFVV